MCPSPEQYTLEVPGLIPCRIPTKNHKRNWCQWIFIHGYFEPIDINFEALHSLLLRKTPFCLHIFWQTVIYLLLNVFFVMNTQENWFCIHWRIFNITHHSALQNQNLPSPLETAVNWKPVNVITRRGWWWHVVTSTTHKCIRYVLKRYRINLLVYSSQKRMTRKKMNGKKRFMLKLLSLQKQTHIT